MAGLRNGLRKIAHARREWAGIPMCLDTHDLVIEPTYPNAEALMEPLRPQADVPDEEMLDTSTVRLRNQFWSSHHRRYVVIYEKDGKVQHGLTPDGPNQVAKMIHTLGASDAWGIEQEKNAVDTLGSLLRHRQFKQYLLTGMFLERSKRSGVHYLFRRLRPTVAITERGKGPMRTLCTLCLHPIGYYAASWAGAMCPTDDVISHLMLMRGDEAMFWRRANQHPAWDPNAGMV